VRVKREKNRKGIQRKKTEDTKRKERVRGWETKEKRR
jgi:hypothetical protein